MLQIPCTAQLGNCSTGRVVVALNGLSLQLKKSVGTEPGFTLLFSYIQALKHSLCPAVVLFHIQWHHSISSITKLFLRYRSGKSTLLSRTIIACRVFHGKSSRCTWHVAIEGSHYKPVKSPFMLMHYGNYCTRGVVETVM